MRSSSSSSRATAGVGRKGGDKCGCSSSSSSSWYKEPVTTTTTSSSSSSDKGTAGQKESACEHNSNSNTSGSIGILGSSYNSRKNRSRGPEGGGLEAPYSSSSSSSGLHNAGSTDLRGPDRNSEAMEMLWDLYLGYDDRERLSKAAAEHQRMSSCGMNQLLVAAPHLIEYGRTAWSKSYSDVLTERGSARSSGQSSSAAAAAVTGCRHKAVGASPTVATGLGVCKSVDWAAVHARLVMRVREGASSGKGGLNAALQVARNWGTSGGTSRYEAAASPPCQTDKHPQQRRQQGAAGDGMVEGSGVGLVGSVEGSLAALAKGSIELLRSPSTETTDLLLSYLSICTEAVIQQIMVEAER